jgi:hypothetical protein
MVQNLEYHFLTSHENVYGTHNMHIEVDHFMKVQVFDNHKCLKEMTSNSSSTCVISLFNNLHWQTCCSALNTFMISCFDFLY